MHYCYKITIIIIIIINIRISAHAEVSTWNNALRMYSNKICLAMILVLQMDFNAGIKVVRFISYIVIAVSIPGLRGGSSDPSNSLLLSLWDQESRGVSRNGIPTPLIIYILRFLYNIHMWPSMRKPVLCANLTYFSGFRCQ